ncbi:MAG: hypothetical protein HQL62_09000, partial [Magnetococcales bacterium]|nr:hypothetical protein [Magnetococcales bacterium]
VCGEGGSLLYVRGVPVKKVSDDGLVEALVTQVEEAAAALRMEGEGSGRGGSCRS